VPVDFMTGRPLGYRVGRDGAWQLHSAGSDGKDDGGDPVPPQGPGRYTSIWDGRDAVWPRLASAAGPGPVIPPSEVLPLIQIENAPLRDVILTLALQIGLNLVFDPAIETQLKSPVNVRFENVSASNLLEVILARHDLRAEWDPAENIVRITRR
jgi:hypothetical protein